MPIIYRSITGKVNRDSDVDPKQKATRRHQKCNRFAHASATDLHPDPSLRINGIQQRQYKKIVDLRPLQIAHLSSARFPPLSKIFSESVQAPAKLAPNIPAECPHMPPIHDASKTVISDSKSVVGQIFLYSNGKTECNRKIAGTLRFFIRTQIFEFAHDISVIFICIFGRIHRNFSLQRQERNRAFD